MAFLPKHKQYQVPSCRALGNSSFSDGARESANDWRDLLLDLKRRGLDVRPELLIADGALGFWMAASEVWPRRPALPGPVEPGGLCGRKSSLANAPCGSSNGGN